MIVKFNLMVSPLVLFKNNSSWSYGGKKVQYLFNNLCFFFNQFVKFFYTLYVFCYLNDQYPNLLLRNIYNRYEAYFWCMINYINNLVLLVTCKITWLIHWITLTSYLPLYYTKPCVHSGQLKKFVFLVFFFLWSYGPFQLIW